MSDISVSQEAIVHALVGAQFGDLEFDLGKSVRWTQWFTDDVYVTDINSGEQRYWVINWAASFPEVNYGVTGINFFTNPADFRRQQWEDASAFAAQHTDMLYFDDEDWVLFVDGHEGLSADNTSLPDDYAIDPFRSFMYREIARAESKGADRVVFPFYVYLRHDNIQNVRYTQPQADPLIEPVRVIQSIGAPYYLPYQGLTRLVKVRALRSGGFDWSSLDKPTTLSSPVLQSGGAVKLTGNVGNWLNVSRGATLPAHATIEYTIHCKLTEMPQSTVPLCGQLAGTNLLRLELDGRMFMTAWSTEGTSTQPIGNTASTNSAPVKVGEPIWLRGKMTYATALEEFWYSSDGQDWTSLGSITGTWAGNTPYLPNTTSLMIGGVTQSSLTFPGEIYECYEVVDGVERIHFLADTDLRNLAPGSNTFTTLSGHTAHLYGTTIPATRDAFFPPAQGSQFGNFNTYGVASSADPGPLPNEFVLIAEIVTASAPPSQSYAPSLASQYHADPNRSWLWRRNAAYTQQLWSPTPTGLAAQASAKAVSVTSAPAANTTTLFALAVQVNNGSGSTVISPFRSTDGGATWVSSGTPNVSTATTMFDTAEPLRIGGWVSYEVNQAPIHWVEARTGLDPQAGGTSLWTPGVFFQDRTAVPSNIAATLSIPVDASGSCRVEAEVSPYDGSTHPVIGGGAFLMYLPYSASDNFYAYFYDSTPTAVGTSVTRAAANGLGVPNSGKWQFKVTWNATTDTLSFHHRAPGPDLMDDTAAYPWILLSSTVYAGKQWRNGSVSHACSSNNGAFTGSGPLWRQVIEVNGVVAMDFDFRYLRSQLGTTWVLPTGQTATITKNATVPPVQTLVQDGILWRCDAAEAAAAGIPTRSDYMLDLDLDANGIADGWEVYSGTNVNDKSLTFVDGYQRIVGTPTVLNSVYGVQTVLPSPAATPGQVYAFEAIFKMSGSGQRAGVTFIASFLDAANATLSSPGSQSIRGFNTDQWVRAEWYGQAPVNTTQVRLIARVQGFTGATGDTTVTVDVQRLSIIPMSWTDARGRKWDLHRPENLIKAGDNPTSAADLLKAPHYTSDVKMQIVSYGYAHWNLQDIEPPATEVPPLTAENDDGWRQRCLLSMVRPITGLPVGSTSDPVGSWVSPSADPAGVRGPWAFDTYADRLATMQDVVIPHPPPAIDPSAAGVLVPLYDTVFRYNMRDGVWYEADGLGNIPLIWNPSLNTWVPAVPVNEWQQA